MVKIWYLPARVDMKAMWRPLGENAGLSLLPFTVGDRASTLRVAKSKILMS